MSAKQEIEEAFRIGPLGELLQATNEALMHWQGSRQHKETMAKNVAFSYSLDQQKFVSHIEWIAALHDGMFAGDYYYSGVYRRGESEYDSHSFVNRYFKKYPKKKG